MKIAQIFQYIKKFRFEKNTNKSNKMKFKIRKTKTHVNISNIMKFEIGTNRDVCYLTNM